MNASIDVKDEEYQEEVEPQPNGTLKILVHVS